MAQIFSQTTDKIIKGAGLLAPLALVGVIAAVSYWWAPAFTDAGYQPEQPVPFSHKLHAGDLGMDCRYCHSSVAYEGCSRPTRWARERSLRLPSDSNAFHADHQSRAKHLDHPT